MLKGKIHRATVTQAELHYVGSITVDLDLLEAAGILEYEKVQVVDIDNGSRFETYTIAGARGIGDDLPQRGGCPVRQCGGQGHPHGLRPSDPQEIQEGHHPAVVFVDEENRVTRVTNYEKHGLLREMP